MKSCFSAGLILLNCGYVSDGILSIELWGCDSGGMDIPIFSDCGLLRYDTVWSTWLLPKF